MKKIYKLSLAFLPIFGFAQNYNVTEIPENLLTNANAVIREHTENYVLKSVNDMSVKETQAITILSKSGD